MKNLAIIGASYLQLPLIRGAKQMGLCTHVFAWAANDVGEKEADYFYPISIVEKERILDMCRKIGIDGICSIASDLAIITVNYVAQNMGLISNSLSCTTLSTNKHLMRNCFEKNGDPSPKSVAVSEGFDPIQEGMRFPLIVKPADRSGSRGIFKIERKEELDEAVKLARAESFSKEVLIEEFAQGQEYSIECISWQGKHTLLQITKKYTTGAPHFIETGHLEPSGLPEEEAGKLRHVIFHALDSLQIRYGASHSEVKIDDSGEIRIIEIGGRMGGDFIGSDLVKLSTGYDFVKAVIDISLGNAPEDYDGSKVACSAVRFIFNSHDIEVFEEAGRDPKVEIVDHGFDKDRIHDTVTDSSNRHGYFIMKSDDYDALVRYL